MIPDFKKICTVSFFISYLILIIKEFKSYNRLLTGVLGHPILFIRDLILAKGIQCYEYLEQLPNGMKDRNLSSFPFTRVTVPEVWLTDS